MIYHVNERKKEQALNLYFALLIPLLSCLFIEAWLLQGPSQQIWTNFLRLSLEIFVLFECLMMCVASSMSSWLWIWPPWKEPKTPENNQIVKVSSNKKLLHYNKKLLLHIPTYLSYIQKMNKIQIPLSAHREGKKIPKPSFAGLPTIKLKQSYYHVYVDYN